MFSYSFFCASWLKLLFSRSNLDSFWKRQSLIRTIKNLIDAQTSKGPPSLLEQSFFESCCPLSWKQTCLSLPLFFWDWAWCEGKRDRGTPKKVQDPELIQIIPRIRTSGNRVAHDFNNAELPLLQESLKGFSVHGFNSKRKEIFVQLVAENILEDGKIFSDIFNDY